jgi:hypothetical protein
VSSRPDWTEAQSKLLRRLVGKVTAVEIARRVSEIGPARSERGVYHHCRRRRISLRTGKRHVPRPYVRWDWRQRAMLESMAGKYTAAAIGARFEAELGIVRSASAVRWYAKRHGLDLRARGRVLRKGDIVGILPMEWETVTEIAESGLLSPLHTGVGIRGSAWGLEEREFARFVAEYAWCFEPGLVRRGRWRSLVDVQTRRCRWYYPNDVAAMLGIHPSKLYRRLRAGEVPGVRRVPWGRRFMRIPVTSLAAIRELAASRRVESGHGKRYGRRLGQARRAS